MIDPGVIRQIVDTYQKHGWILRRVLLSEAAENALSGSKNELFGDIATSPSDIDAAWFSREPTGGETAWELRYLGDIAYALLVYVDESSSEFEASIGELSLSVFGKFKAQSIKVPLSGDSEKGGVLKIAEAKGRTSLFGILSGDKYDAKAEAIILSFSKGDFGLKVDSLELVSELTQTKSGGTTKVMNGTVSLQAEAAQVTYRENKYLEEEIVVPFLKIVIKARAQQNNIQIETGEAMGRLLNVQMRGSLSVGNQTDLNLNLTLKPTNEFYEKYQDKDLRTLLKFANLMHEDGPGIELCEGLRALSKRDRMEAAQRFEAALEIDPSNERAARELADMRRQATNERKGLLTRLMGKKES